MTLRDLEIGASAVIDTVGGEGELRQHFLDKNMPPWETLWSFGSTDIC